MVEFISENYWLRDNPSQYKDVRERFSASPFLLSDGSIANYLDELVEEKKIRNWREGNLSFYCPPKMALALKFVIAMTVFCFSLIVSLYFVSNYIALSIIGFYVGVLITSFLWANSKPESSQNIKKNKILHRKKPKKEG